MEQTIRLVEKVVECLATSETLYTNVAKIAKRVYDALLDVGFTEEQAMKILLNTVAKVTSSRESA